MKKDNSLVVNQENTVVEYGTHGANFAQMLAEELDGLPLSFDRIKIPAGGGIMWELPSDNPDDPDMAKEFKGVIVYHHPIHVHYKDKYTGGNTPPDCSSTDGKVGIDAEGEIQECRDCAHSEFGSGDDGVGKACKQKRRIYILRENEVFPLLLTLPTMSLGDYGKFVARLLSKGKKSSGVVTRFSLKKAQNAGGITYSQVVCTVERNLTPEEQNAVTSIAEQVKKIAGKMRVANED